MNESLIVVYVARSTELTGSTTDKVRSNKYANGCK